MSVREYLANPPKEAEPNEFADFKKYPCWGRPTIEEKDHPWFPFFQEKFDCTNFVKNPQASCTVHHPDLPKNLLSTGFYGVRTQFDSFLKKQEGYAYCSDFLKKYLLSTFWREVSKANRGLPNPLYHDGKNLSRGCLSRFLNNMWNVTFEVEMLTENDRKFIMRYLFCVTKKIQIQAMKSFLKRSA